jgi:1-acyl-sn-glycerol-3-phosphate acyltransferase
MIRTIFFFFLTWLTLILSIVVFIPFPLFYLTKEPLKTARKYIWFWAHYWSRFAIFLSGSKLVIEGKENIPEDPHFAILSNHQGLMDIPVLLACFPYSLSFVAKKELINVPFINLWLLAQECLLIDRSKPFSAHKKIARHLSRENSKPLIIFPEGTRSRSQKEGRRKKGGIHLVKNSGIPVIYTRINGSYRIWEEKKRIRPALIEVKITKKYLKIGE